MIRGFGVGGPAAGPELDPATYDDKCRHTREDGVQCIRPKGHTADLHFYPPETEEENGQ
jgi:hypothetical protein